MTRQNTAGKAKLATFRKIGGGTFTYKGKQYTNGQTFKADPKDIPKAFADIIVLVKEAKKE
jgi:hypothetical protein